MNPRERQELAQQLKEKGWAFVIDTWPDKLTYYKQDGEAMPNLPADPVSLKRYLARGFTLSPPQSKKTSKRRKV